MTHAWLLTLFLKSKHTVTVENLPTKNSCAVLGQRMVAEDSDFEKFDCSEEKTK